MTLLTVKAARRAPNWIRAWPLIPVLLFLSIIFLYPVVQLLSLSIFDQSGGLTISHYSQLFTSPVYFTVLLITLKISVWTTLLCLLGGYPVAYALSATSERRRAKLMLWVLLPFWTSFLVRSFAWIVLLGRNGLVDDFLTSLGVIEARPSLIYNMTGVLIGMVHGLMPLAILTMVPVMTAIDRNLTKAAATLGARGAESFWRVYFPLSMPGVAAAGLLVFITSLGFFITPALLGGLGEIMISQLIIEQVQTLLNWPLAGAVSVLLLTSAILVFYLYDRLLGLTTLTGEAPAKSSFQPHNGIGQAGSRFSSVFIATMGRIGTAIGEAVERVLPVRLDRPPRVASSSGIWVAAALVLAFLAIPSLFIIPVSFTSGSFLEWPPRLFSLHWYETYFESPVWLAATVRSLVIGVVSATAATLIGTPAAFFLAHRQMRGKTAMLAFILSPLIVPRIIIAVALFYFYARIGLIGSSLGLMLGHTVLAIPYVVVTVMAVLKSYDTRLDQAASVLGAGRLQTLRYVTLPIISSGLVAAFLFAFVTSFDELTIALFVTGGLTTTLPKQMWDDALLKVSPTLAAVSTLLLVFVTFMILAAEWLRRRTAAAR